MNAILILSKSLYLLSGISTIGFLLSITFFAPNHKGLIKSENFITRRRIAVASLIWAVSSAIFIIATLASVLELSFFGALHATMLRSFLTQIALGKFLAIQSTVALLVAIFSVRVKRVGGAAILLLFSLVGISAPIFESHSTSGGSHLMAIGTLLLHVVAITLWVGGLIAIWLSPEVDRQLALKRFSNLALWSAVTVIVTGSINAWIRLDFKGSLNSQYAYVIFIKVVLTTSVLLIAAQIRKYLSQSSKKLLTFESLLLILITSLGAYLSTLAAPERPGFIDNLEALVGLKFPGQPTLERLIFAYQPDALTLGILIIALALYTKGIRILYRRGDKWPAGRTIAFISGLIIVNYAVNGGIGIYAHFAFSYHMIEHMILGMIAPIAIVLGAPLTLALRVLPGSRDGDEEGVRALLVRFLHSGYAKFITNPIVALLIFDGSLFILYFTKLFGVMMGSHLGHLVMNFHFLMAGILFFHIIVGVDPNPNRPPNIVRIVILFAAMSIHAFFSIALMSATTLLDGGYYQSIGNPLHLNLLENQYKGGAIGWAMGEIPILIALTAAFIQWMRDDKKESKRIDRNAARASAMGEADDLTKYNQYLADLARRDQSKDRPNPSEF